MGRQPGKAVAMPPCHVGRIRGRTFAQTAIKVRSVAKMRGKQSTCNRWPSQVGEGLDTEPNRLANRLTDTEVQSSLDATLQSSVASPAC